MILGPVGPGAENGCMKDGGSPYRNRAAHFGRTLAAVAIASMIAVLLFSLALTFSNASAATRVAASSERLHWSNASAAAVAITRASVNQAFVFGIDTALGVASADDAEIALNEAAHAVDALDRWIGSTPDDLVSTKRQLTDLEQIGRDAISAIEVGDLDEASRIIEEALEPEVARVTSALGENQAVFAAQIDSAKSAAGRTERITRLLVTLVIPMAAIALHQIIVRRQYRRRKQEMEVRLDGERRLNKAKDELIAGLSHELRTPLTSILGFSEYLLDSEAPSREELSELVGLINRDSSELQRMVDDLLTAARVDADALAIAPEATDLAGIGEALAVRLRRDGHSAAVYGRDTVAWADPSRVRQIVRNLTSNAVRHGGARIEIKVETDRGHACMTVSDNGDGVSDAAERRIFERFVYEGHETLLNGSVGLGLAVSRTLAEMMGGSLAYRRDNGWSHFTLALPPAPEGAEPSHVEAIQTNHARHDPIDDDPLPPDALVASIAGSKSSDLVISFDHV